MSHTKRKTKGEGRKEEMEWKKIIGYG